LLACGARNRETVARESGRGQPHSKKLARNRTLLLEILTSEPLAFRLRGEFFERHVEDRIFFPAIEVEVPPFGFINSETFGFHGAAQQIS